MTEHDKPREALQATIRSLGYTTQSQSREIADAVLAALAASAPSPVTAREVASSVFALCEETEALEDAEGASQTSRDFLRGRRFEAKQIRRGIGTWLTDEENARKAPPHPTSQEGQATPRETDLSKKLRLLYEALGMPHNVFDRRHLLQAADEIERYYGGMLAWKATAEAKDRDMQQAAAQPQQSAEVRGLTDSEIEAAFKAAGGRWDGDRWVIEDADLHPFVRGITPPADASRQAQGQQAGEAG
jgi:hypothetical protein